MLFLVLDLLVKTWYKAKNIAEAIGGTLQTNNWVYWLVYLADNRYINSSLIYFPLALPSDVYKDEGKRGSQSLKRDADFSCLVKLLKGRKVEEIALLFGRDSQQLLSLIFPESVSKIESFHWAQRVSGCHQFDFRGFLIWAVTRVRNYLSGALKEINPMDFVDNRIYSPLPKELALDTIWESASFSARINNVLRRAGYTSIGLVSSLTEEEFLELRNIGKDSCREAVDQLIQQFGISFATESIGGQGEKRDVNVNFEPNDEEQSWLNSLSSSLGISDQMLKNKIHEVATIMDKDFSWVLGALASWQGMEDA